MKTYSKRKIPKNIDIHFLKFKKYLISVGKENQTQWTKSINYTNNNNKQRRRRRRRTTSTVWTINIWDQELIAYGYSSCCCCMGARLQKSLRLRRFKSDRGKILQDCSWRKYSSIDGDRLPMWRHTFKMAAVTSFHSQVIFIYWPTFFLTHR